MAIKLQVYDGTQCIMDSIPMPAVLCQCLRDDGGTIIDYRYLIGNEGFDRRMEREFPHYRGKPVRELFPYLESDPFERIQFVNAAMHSPLKQNQTYFYSRFWKMWVQMFVYPLGDDSFMAIYPDTAETN